LHFTTCPAHAAGMRSDVRQLGHVARIVAASIPFTPG
jgi:hypothetical protein